MDKLRRPFRRVVTGHDANGKSCVFMDSDAPNVTKRPTGSIFTEFWTIENAPAVISGNKDGGDRPLSISPPDLGAHFRIVDAPAEKEAAIDAKTAGENISSLNLTGTSEHRPDGPHWNMHRTATVDYGFVLEGDRVLILEDSELVVHPGDVIVHLGSWHSWENRTNDMGATAFDMIGGEFPD